MTTTQSKLAKDLPNDLIDERLKSYQKPEDFIGESGLLKQLTKKLVERALQAEMTDHLGHDKHERSVTLRATPATVKAVKPSKASLVNCPLKSRVTVVAVSSHSLSPSSKRAGLDLTIKSSHSMPAA